jgi:AAA ATPase domain/Helix-turn-helix domain
VGGAGWVGDVFDTAVLEQMADGIATLKEFGAALTAVRNAAHASLRQIERDSGIPRSTVHGYCTGGHLPSLAQADALGRILVACGVVDRNVVARWMAAYDRVRQAPGPRPSPDQPPYRGLDSFQPEDAPWFFGREGLTAQLLARIGGPRADERLLLVTGASGSGKSSLLRAGLIPAALAQGRPFVLMAPGAEPLTALVGQLCPAPDAAARDGETLQGRLKRQNAALAALELPADLLVVVDQLEELFTACREEDERSAFVAALGALAADGRRGDARIVLCLRADFYAQTLLYPLLRAGAQHGQIVSVR